MLMFISAGEPSGDLHAGNLLHSLRRLLPDTSAVGYGGPRLQAAGGRLLFPLTQLSVMWFPHVLKSYRTFLGLIRQADEYFRDYRPDAVVLIDYPGLHWWLARRAKERGIPVFYFVPPQLWAWGAWRVEKMRRYVDHILCSLPFEPQWYRDRGIEAHHFGHPYFDELQRQPIDADFLATQRQRGTPIVAVLPGSRQQEVRNNWPTFRLAVKTIHARRPDARFLVGAFNHVQQHQIVESLREDRLPIEVHVGRTPEIIRLATACLSVSGSVGLELLYAGLPSVVSYRLRRIDIPFVRMMMKSQYVSLVNLLAGDELFPEFLTSRCRADEMAARILHWLDHAAELARCRTRLMQLKDAVGSPGACDRAAEFILDRIGARISTEIRS